jgi:hypothetical protein
VGEYPFLFKFHFEIDSRLRPTQSVEYHEVIGTKNNKGTAVGVHTHEHVEIGTRIDKKLVPHFVYKNMMVWDVYAVRADGSRSRRFNPLDFCADANPKTASIIEVAAITGPHEASKYADIAQVGITLGGYAISK